MKILLAQLKPKVGDLAYNFALIKKYYTLSLHQELDLCLLPEMITTGYSPKDLLLHSAFMQDLQSYLSDFIKLVKKTAILIPTPFYQGKHLFNGVIAVQNAEIIGQTTKKYLPNYGIFDEKRYFTEGTPQLIEINGTKIGLPICEDFWSADLSMQLKSMGAEILLVPNASPYEQNKFTSRIKVAQDRFQETQLPIIYCNQVLGQDGIVFDGRSFIYDGDLKYVLSSFAEEAIKVDISLKSIESCIVNSEKLGAKRDGAKPIYNRQAVSDNVTNCSSINYNYHFELLHSSCTEPYSAAKILHHPQSIAQEDEIYGAMVLGLRDYTTQNGFKSILLGLSGGIDSALVAAIAADTIGPRNVRLVMMPSEFTSKESLEDAETIAQMLDIEYLIIPIIDMLKLAKDIIPDVSDFNYQNLQSRMRGVILMTLSNSSNSLLLTTGNKSENATGYTTLYGDMCGGFNPVQDLYKTELYKVARFRNQNIPQSITVQNCAIPIMPERVFTKPPSAELANNQQDTDSLPEYDLLDQILNLHIEQNLASQDIINLGFQPIIVHKVIELVKKSEFKRQQSALGIKLSSCHLGKDRRYNVTNGY